MFDRVYCHHRLILWQKDGLQNMWKLIDDQLAELNIQDQTQMNNIELLLPSLQAKGLAVHITNTLGWPDVVGESPFSYPLYTWTLPNQDYPVTPTPPPTPFIHKSKKKRKYGGRQGTSLAVCTPLCTLLIIHIPPSFYFAYIHLLLFGYHLNLSCSH